MFFGFRIRVRRNGWAVINHRWNFAFGGGSPEFQSQLRQDVGA